MSRPASRLFRREMVDTSPLCTGDVECKKCYFFQKAIVGPGDGCIAACCDHPICYEKVPYQKYDGTIGECKNRVANIIDLNLTGNCVRFRSFKIVVVRKRWWFFSYWIKKKVLGER